MNSNSSLEQILLENLRNWFKEKWVDISRKEGGKHPPCGSSANDKKRRKNPKHGYPKCLPKSKAKNLTKDEKKRLVNRKRKKVKTKMNSNKPVWVTNKKTLKKVKKKNKGD